jgi:hypothetical protein
MEQTSENNIPLNGTISSRLKPIMRSHGFDPLYPEKKEKIGR